VSRLSQSDVSRLVVALRGEATPASAPSAGVATGSIAPPPQADGEVGRVKSAVASAIDAGSLADAIANALRTYLNRDVSCDISADGAPPENTMRFEAGDAIALHVDLDASLAAALADIGIGGDGTNTRHGKRIRIGRQLEPLVLELMQALAQAAALGPPPEAHFIDVARRHATVVGVGTITVAGISGGWSAGVAVRESRASAPAPAKAQPDTPLRTVPSPAQPSVPREVVYAVSEPAPADTPPRTSAGAPPQPRERVLGARSAAEPQNAFGAAVEAARGRLGEMTHCPTVLESIRVERVDAPALQRDDLKLALIAGGQGSLVLSADRETVASVAASATGVDAVDGREPGAVALDAVEAVLRAALRGFAEKLPAIAGTPARFVRLDEGALPARSPHFAIVAPVRIGERPATLHWLVPAWMAGARGEVRASIDAP
jgi:hypothetical protein